MKHARRIVSLLLALVMIWGLVPVGTVEAEAAGEPMKTGWYWPLGPVGRVSPVAGYDNAHRIVAITQNGHSNSNAIDIGKSSSWDGYFDSHVTPQAIGKLGLKPDYQGNSTKYKVKDLIKGLPVYAIWDGIVTYNGDLGSGKGGYTIRIEHTIGNDTYVSEYAHLYEMALPAKNTSVRKGQLIGYVGNSGNVTTHLHFDIAYYEGGKDYKKGYLNKKYSTMRLAPADAVKEGQRGEIHYVYTVCEHERKPADCFNSNGFCTKCGASFDWNTTKKIANYTLIPKNRASLTIESRPYDESTALYKTAPQTRLKSDYQVENHWPNHVWYHVNYNGIDGYVWSGHVTATKEADRFDFQIDPIPTSFVKGERQGVSGTVSSTAILESVTVAIYRKTDMAEMSKDTASNLNTNSYNIANLDKSIAFRLLEPGEYIYHVAAKDRRDDTATCVEWREQSFTVIGSKAIPTYTVSFSANGGMGGGMTRTVSAGGSVSLSGIQAPTRYNHTFLGWSQNAGATSASYAQGGYFTPSGSTTLYAVWQEILPPAAPFITSGTQHVGEGKGFIINWSSVPGADHYVVKYYNSAGIQIDEAKTPGTSHETMIETAGGYSVNVTAVNTAGPGPVSNSVIINVHRPSVVTFLNHDDTVHSTQTVGYGDSAYTPEAPSRKGYTFSGWDGSLYDVREENRTLRATYRPIPYTVNFYNCEGKVAKTQTVYYDGDTPGAATPPDASELGIPSGYVLAGWDTNEYLSVTRSGIHVKPAVVWGNEDVPITIEISSVSQAGNGYWVYYTITNHVSSAKTGRVVIVLKSNFGKFLTKTESGAFYLAAGDGTSYQGNLYVPLEGALQDEVFSTVEAYVVGSYISLTPVSAPDSYNVLSADGDWSPWMTAEELSIYPHSYDGTQTKTQYRSKTKQISEWTTNTSYLDWTRNETRTVKSAWSGWSNWQDDRIYANDNCNVNTRFIDITAGYTLYRLGRYTDNKGHIHFSNILGNSNYPGTWVTQYTAWSTSPTPIATEYYGYSTSNNSLGNGIWHNNRYRWHKYTIGSKIYYWQETQYVQPEQKEQFQCQTRYDITQYNYYNWPDWSEWSDTAVSANSNRQVETQTLTRVKLTTPPSTGAYRLTGSVGVPEAGGKQAILTVYKVDEASDYSNEYMAQVELGENGAYDFSFDTLEKPSIKSGDFTAVLTIEGSDTPLYIGTIEAPKPTYEVTFVDMDGVQLGETQTVEEGDAATAPEIPTREGYTFIGWEYGLTNIRDNMIISARYVPNKYTVVYADWANGSISMVTDVPYGSMVTPPEMEAREGYTFRGWKAPDGMSLDNVTGSMIVTAQYDQMQYTVRFLDVDGTVLSTVEVGHGEAATAPDESEITVPSGMYVEGWNTYAYENVTQPLDIVAAVSYEEETAYPEVSVEPGTYEGTQTVDISCADEDAAITYSFLTADEGEAGETDMPYTTPIEIAESAVLQVTCSAEGKSQATETFEYVIVPEGTRPSAPETVTASGDTEKVTVNWDAIEDATGYVIYKEDVWGSSERFMTEETSYEDSNVASISNYSYKVSTFTLYESAATSTFLESEDVSEPATVTFYGEQLPVTGITVNAPENMLLGDSAQLSAMIAPVNAFDQTVTWTVKAGTGNATISGNGVLTATRAGAVTVTATANDGSRTSGSATVQIAAPIGSNIPLAVTSATLRTGQRAKVSVTLGANSGAEMIEFALLYDSSAVTLTESEAGAAMAGKEPTINDTIPGVVYFNWDSTTALTADGSLLDLTFTAVANATEQDVILTVPTDSEDYSFIFKKGDMADIALTARNGKLSIMNVLLGDVNLDSAINVIDANMIRRYAAQLITLDENQLAAADVSGDGKVNVIDANLIRRYAAKLIQIFPADPAA